MKMKDCFQKHFKILQYIPKFGTGIFIFSTQLNRTLISEYDSHFSTEILFSEFIQ